MWLSRLALFHRLLASTAAQPDDLSLDAATWIVEPTATLVSILIFIFILIFPLENTTSGPRNPRISNSIKKGLSSSRGSCLCHRRSCLAFICAAVPGSTSPDLNTRVQVVQGLSLFFLPMSTLARIQATLYYGRMVSDGGSRRSHCRGPGSIELRLMLRLR